MGNDRWSPCKGGLLLHCKWSTSVQYWIITSCSLAHIVPLSWEMTVGPHVKAVCCFMIHEVESRIVDCLTIWCFAYDVIAIDNLPLCQGKRQLSSCQGCCCFIVHEVDLRNCDWFLCHNLMPCILCNSLDNVPLCQGKKTVVYVSKWFLLHSEWRSIVQLWFVFNKLMLIIYVIFNDKLPLSWKTQFVSMLLLISFHGTWNRILQGHFPFWGLSKTFKKGSSFQIMDTTIGPQVKVSLIFRAHE